MTEFIFIRHGETEMNTRPDLVGGRTNHTPLTERGREQATKLGQFFLLSSEFATPTAIYSSPAHRAVATGLISCAEAGFSAPTIIQDERLLEISHGNWEGMSRDEVYTDENVEQYRINDIDGKLPGGESVVDVQQRMYSFLDEIHGKHPDGIIHVYSHGFAIRALAGLMRNLSKQQILAEETDNVSLTAIGVTDHIPSVQFVGRTVISE